MHKSGSNPSIGCMVSECEHHCGHENCCSLTNITVGKSRSNPTSTDCTECSTFKVKR